ncbi:MAG TPA: TIGR00282 family metallophosphoesterase [Candidatus Acidoferrales bacterium]|nr:TIGR00282 family metallophosphoesterase [Candidatus Acidoferrales bacterium]
MRILFIGDIVGAPGRRIVLERLQDIVANEQIDLVVANGENAASGFGITPRLSEELLSAGIEVLSGGNHIWDRKEILDFIPREPRLLRPANFPSASPGSGLFCGMSRLGIAYAVLCLQGRIFMVANDDPFSVADRELARVPSETKVIIVDIHAEATSEKRAMGWHLDGRVSAVIGTHTHVATADDQILPGGTAYITDVGMTGPHDSIIGMEKAAVIKRFLDGMPIRYEVATGDIQMNALFIEVDSVSGRAVSVARRRYRLEH